MLLRIALIQYYWINGAIEIYRNGVRFTDLIISSCNLFHGDGIASAEIGR